MPPKEKTARNNPASQALRKGRTFRDLRASESQITAEQLIAQAQELQRLTGTVRDPSKILLSSATELALYRQNTRSEFEAHVQKSFLDFGGWVRYAAWEEENGALACVRSIFERALPHHGEKKEFWRQYAEAEQRIGTADHARAILQRGTTSLPQCHELWLKFVALEQATHSDDNTRQVFHRWMMTKPPAFVWRLAVQFECYRGQVLHATAAASTTAGEGGFHNQQTERVRLLLKDLVMHHNVAASWAFYAGIELHALRDASRAIDVLKTALKALPNSDKETALHLLLAESLEASGDSAGARKTLVSLLEYCTRDAQCLPEVREDVFNALAAFERSSSSRCAATSSLTAAERAQQEDALINAQVRMRYRFIMDQQHDTNRQGDGNSGSSTVAGATQVLDAFASLAALDMSSSSSPAVVEDVLQRGVAVTPRSDVDVQQHASLAMALARRLSAPQGNSDSNHARHVAAKDLLLKELQSFPHGRLKNPALWTETCRAILACEAPDAVDVVRKVLGQAIGACPDDELFQFYVWLEVEYISGPDSASRAREIYKAWLDRFPLRRTTWTSFAMFEFQQYEVDRADAIFKMGIKLLSQRAKEAKSMAERFEYLDEVDALWKDRLRCSMKRGSSAEGGRASAAAQTAVVYEELLDQLLDQYFSSFENWRGATVDAAEKKAAALVASDQQQQQNQRNHQRNKDESATAVTTEPPRRFVPPPSVAGAPVQPMIRRLADGLSGRIGFERRAHPQTALDVMRDVFRSVVAKRRGAVQQGIAADAEFQQVMVERQWVELSLSPVFHLWRQMEAEFGSTESLAAVAEVAEPPKKKSRLFKSK